MTLKELERQHISYIFHKENGKVDRVAAKLESPQFALRETQAIRITIQ